MRRVRRRRIKVDTERERRVLDRAGGELQAVVPAKATRHAAERPALGLHHERVTQRGEHLGRAGLHRDRPAHDRAREVIDEQRHPRAPGSATDRGDHEHRQLIVIGLPDRVAMRRLVPQIQPMLAPPRLPPLGRRALRRSQLTRERRLQRAQRRHVVAELALLTPHGRDAAAQPDIRVAQLVVELDAA